LAEGFLSAFIVGFLGWGVNAVLSCHAVGIGGEGFGIGVVVGRIVEGDAGGAGGVSWGVGGLGVEGDRRVVDGGGGT
jgi:hypothetical protein